MPSPAAPPHDTEPTPDPDLRRVVDDELRLLTPEVRADRDAVLRLLHEDFREFGASGRVWDRSGIVEAVAGDLSPVRGTEDVSATRLGPDSVLVTYVLHGPRTTSLRSSVWRRDGDRWRVLFHQGTPVP